MLKIFSWGSDWFGTIVAPERELRRQEETIDPGSRPVGDIWPETNICWRSLVGARGGSGYLVRINIS